MGSQPLWGIVFSGVELCYKQVAPTEQLYKNQLAKGVIKMRSSVLFSANKTLQAGINDILPSGLKAFACKVCLLGKGFQAGMC